MVGNDQRSLAVRRSKLKRYLSLLGLTVPNDMETDSLVGLVKSLHKKRGRLSYAWPMTGEQVELLAKQEHITNQLISMKIMFGIDSTIGIVDANDPHGRRNYRTVAELVAAGHASRRMLRIDENIGALKLIKYNR